MASNNTGAAILKRLFQPNQDNLSADAARSLLALDFPGSDHARMAELSAKAQAGTLAAEEHAELQEYLRVADLLAILQSWARKSLRRLGRAS
jgi:hypothetical protein